MKKILITFISVLLTNVISANNIDTLSHTLDEVSVVSFYRNNLMGGNLLNKDNLTSANKGQEPSFIFETLPSVFAYSDTGNEFGYAYFRIRGIDQTRINVTIDGMPLNEGEDMGVYYSNFPDLLSSTNSIEIYKGATIFNNGTCGYGGSINFESVNLNSDERTTFYMGCGSWETNKASLEYNSGKRGKWAYNIRGTIQNSDGFRDYAFNESKSISAKIGYNINSNHYIDFLTFSGLSKNGQAWIGSSLEDLAINSHHNGCTEKETDKFFQTINKIQYKGFVMENSIIIASIYYNYLNGHYLFDWDNYNHTMLDPNCKATNEIYTYNLQHHMIGGNFAIKSFFGDNIVWTNGINASTFNRKHFMISNSCDGHLYDNKGYKNDINIFTQFDYTYNKFNFSQNIQYRHADFDYKGDVAFDKINWDFLNYSTRFKYDFTKHLNAYVLMTSTNREPTRSDMFGGEDNLIELYTTQHESVTDYEWGVSFQNEKLFLNLNTFYMDFENELILNGAYGTNGLIVRENVAKSFRRGVELSINYHPTKWLTLINNSSFSENKIQYDGYEMTHTMSPSWLVYQDVMFTCNKLHFGVNMKYRSGMFIDLANEYNLGNSLKFNLYADYTIKKATLGIKINNIFNNTSYSNGMLGFDKPLYFIDAPTNFIADIKFSF